MAHLNELHTRKFHVFIPEYYVSRISPYFTEKRQTRPPMINGVPVTMDEYMAKDPEFVPDEEFIPEPIYDPFECNITFSTKSVVEIYNAYINDVNIQFKNPADMLTMIDIIKEYLSVAAVYANSNANVASWNDRLTDFAIALRDTHDEYQRKRFQRLPHKTNVSPGTKSISELITLFRRV